MAQYYNFLRLGKEGYHRIHQTSQEVALYLSGRLAEMGPFRLISDGSEPFSGRGQRQSRNEPATGDHADQHLDS